MNFQRLALALLAVCLPPLAGAQTVTTPFLPVSDTASVGSMPLAVGSTPAAIYYDASDATVVGTAANALAADMKRVTGLTPAVATGTPAAATSAIVVGTVGKSSFINSLVAQGLLDVSDIQGQWEMYKAVVVSNAFPGVGQTLVIAGSDRRGAAFGLFGLSEAIGVSPWYWWADVTPATRTALYVGAGSYTEPSPGVKYRGLFLNDEDWGLNPWASQTFDPATANIGPNTYAKYFELLLRLHANFCWPAMHDITKAFDTYPQNKVVADNYAIVMGSSHHEPMLRNTSEYNATLLGPYNYWTNRTNVYNFWDQRVRDNAAYENIYTIGMRGQTDDGIIAPAGTTTQGKADELQNVIIPDQRQMLANRVNANPALVPQIFVPYKEALTLYQTGMQIPDDVTLVWPDDNHGYIRELSTGAEQTRGGGSGIYYHLSYWGVPLDFLWLCTTPPGLIWEEMSKAWDYNTKRLWLVNIGDLKPGEIGAEFFLRMARNPEAFRNFNQHKYLSDWAARTFGSANADAIASVLDEYYRLNITVRPEHLNLNLSGFSLTANGDESQQRLTDFVALSNAADSVYSRLPSNLKDAYYEMVLYPVHASALMNQKVLMAERSRLWAVQGRAATATMAANSQGAYNSIQAETSYYNTGTAKGKWNLMMSAHPEPTSGDVFTMPAVGSYNTPTAPGLGVAVEGAATPLTTATPGALPVFNPAANRPYFIDVFNTGAGAFLWIAQASAAWITLSQTSGVKDARILVNVDWTKAPRGTIPGTVTIFSGSTVYTVNLSAYYPTTLNLASLPAAVENNGIVNLEAENFTASQDGSGVGWRKALRAVASYDGMTILPATATSVDPSAVLGAPSLSYQFYTFGSGPVTIKTACLPTHHINSEHPGVRYAIALNDETPQVINVDADENSAAWSVNVLRATAYGVSSHTVAAPGLQTLKIYMVDAGVVLDRFNVQIGYVPGGEFEAENLTAAASSGQTYRVYTDSQASGGAAVALESTKAGDHFTLALPNLQAGDYRLAVRFKELNNRGKVTMSIADTLFGVYTQVGSEMDLYSAAAVYAEFASIPVSLSSAGTKYLRFQVTGINAANTSGLAWIALDRIVLTPQPAATGNSSLQAWRFMNYGQTSNSGDAADTADPDGDGISNLLEYATGSYPTLSNGVVWYSTLVNNHLALTFPRARAASDITYHVLAGDDLSSPGVEIWSSAGIPYAGGNLPTSNVTVTDPQTVNAAPRRYLRLQITRP